MFEKLLVKLAKQLDKEKIPYMLIGGQAILLYGEPRLTEDIDITLGVDTDFLENVKRICFNIDLIKANKTDDEFTKKTNVFPCIDRKTGIRIDLIFSYLDYERQAINRAKLKRINNYPVKFASVEDVIIHKLFAGRARDIEDVNGIIVRQGRKKINLKYIKKWLVEFKKIPQCSNISDKFEELIKKK
ncbi:MAG: nucleotidyl transferase AbiEii/AbiGii toxin family protein [Elusimicrobia bacterium]|nr:nucleotidyl transferase AbiEii/AbiGii toxin family protein [Elusimicrobiota bacterium]